MADIERIYVKPSDPERLVPDTLGGGMFPTEGAWVERTIYITRRLADGSLVEAPPPAGAEKPAAAEQPAQPEAPDAPEHETGTKRRSAKGA